MEQEQIRNSTGEEQAQTWLSTTQVSVLFNVSENVIRKLTAEYKRFLKIKKGRRNKNLISQESVYVLRQIREMSLNGLTKKDIRESLKLSQVAQQESSAQPKREGEQNESSELSPGKAVVPRGNGRAKLSQILKKYQAQLAQLEHNFESLQKENEGLKTEIEGIKSDRSQVLNLHMEKIAKLEYKLQKIEEERNRSLWQSVKRWFVK